MVEDSGCGDQDGPQSHVSEDSHGWQAKNHLLCTAENTSLPPSSAGQPHNAKRKRSGNNRWQAVGGAPLRRPTLDRAAKRKLVFGSPSSLEDNRCSNTSYLLSQPSGSGFQSCKAEEKYVSRCQPDFLLHCHSVGHINSSEEKRDVSFEQCKTEDCQQGSSSDVSVSTVVKCRRVKLVRKQNRKQSACRVLKSRTDCTRVSKQKRGSTCPSIADDLHSESSSIAVQPSGRSRGCSIGPSVGKPDVVPVCVKKAPGMSGKRWSEVPPLKNLNTILSGKQIKHQLAFTGDIVMDFKRAPHSKLQVDGLLHALKWPNQPGRCFSGPLLKRFQRNLTICRNCEDNSYVSGITMDVSKLNLSRINRSTITMGHHVTFTKCVVHNLPIACLGLQDDCSHTIVYH